MKIKWLMAVGVSFFLVALTSANSVSASEKEFEIGVTKGAYAIENGSYEEAQTYLKKALAVNKTDAHALLLMGIALSRAENYSEAQNYLTDALQQAPDSWRGKFELGVVQYHLGAWDAAGNLFEEVQASNADAHAKSVAQKYLARMAGGDEKPYSLKLYTGWQYDDNVVLEPENVNLWEDEDESDGRWLALFEGKVTFLQTDRFKANAGYSYFHSFHDRLSQFDLEQHNISLAGAYDPDGPLKAELKYQFSYSDVDGYDYSNIQTIGGIISMEHSPESQSAKFRTEVHYDHEFQDYEHNEYDTWFDTENSYFNSLRTGHNDVVGITEKILFNKNNLLALDYTYNRKKADDGGWYGGAFWGFDGHKGTISLTSNIRRWQLFLAASYLGRNYEEYHWPSLWPADYREDKVQEYTAAITWNPYNWLSISLTENYTIDDSNVEEAYYKRNIIGLVVGVGI